MATIRLAPMALQTAIVLNISFGPRIGSSENVQESNRSCSEDGDILRSCDFGDFANSIDSHREGFHLFHQAMLE
jgi:hypothetical protein